MPPRDWNMDRAPCRSAGYCTSRVQRWLTPMKEDRMAAYTIKPLVTATAINTGGRNGHSETTDHSVSVNLSVRKEMGGPGLPDTTTPEHLFAAGYAACFGGALEYVASQKKKSVAGAVVTCHVSVGPREGGGFGIAVKMQVKIPGMPAAEARTLAQETHE